MSTDNIADVLTKIRNAYLAHHKFVMIPNTRLNYDLCCAFTRIGLVGNMELIKIARSKNKGGIWLHLNCVRSWIEKGNIGLRLTRISKLTRRVYKPALELPKGRTGVEYYLISTSTSGILTDNEARTAKVGGEVLCWISITR
jgi:small subunit ribosomal protein S8